jgi:hypothetical protein
MHLWRRLSCYSRDDRVSYVNAKYCYTRYCSGRLATVAAPAGS